MNHPGNSLKQIPPAPDTLSIGARQEWKALAPDIFRLKTGRPADERALELLCEILSDIRCMEATIRSEGYTVTSSGGPKAHPVLRNLEAQRRQAQQLLLLFDLLPSGRQIWDNYKDNDND